MIGVKGERHVERVLHHVIGPLAGQWVEEVAGQAQARVVFDERIVAPATGELFLFCTDAKPAQNEGSIRATVILNPQAAPADSE